MKWPFVSRAAFAAMQEARDYERQGTQALRESYADLLARYHMLKLQGFVAPSPAPTATTPPAVDPITHAINLASAGKDARVRRGMVKQAKIDADAGVSVDDIIARIQRGNRPAEDVG